MYFSVFSRVLPYRFKSRKVIAAQRVSASYPPKSSDFKHYKDLPQNPIFWKFAGHLRDVDPLKAQGLRDIEKQFAGRKGRFLYHKNSCPAGHPSASNPHGGQLALYLHLSAGDCDGADKTSGPALCQAADNCPRPARGGPPTCPIQHNAIFTTEKTPCLFRCVAVK